MLSGEQQNLFGQVMNRPAIDLFEGLSTQEVMSSCDIEDRINEWLESRGIRPESPSMKKHAHFNQSRAKTFVRLSDWTDDLNRSDIKPLCKKTTSQSTIAEDGLHNSYKIDLDLSSCQGSSLLSRRGIKAANLRIESEWSPVSVRLDNTGADRQMIDSKLNKSTILSRRRLLNIEPINIPSIGKLRSNDHPFTAIGCEEDDIIDFQMFSSAKELKPLKCLVDENIETRGRLATTGSMETTADYSGIIRQVSHSSPTLQSSPTPHSSLKKVQIPRHYTSVL